ncbi:MAG: glycosyltransferase family 39 protein [Candidatus Daviesbacteria bacterium]|nr:MAG: glycosyltransferase family 39 protein [Candidatus Daviesbacteria bacterium]
MVNIEKRFNLLVILVLLIFSPLFFYKLGDSSLVSFDEAWYGSIARNIAQTGDFINLTWNGSSYLDHPPAVFSLMAVLIKTFGDSEFWVRATSAILGLASLAVVYFLGKELFNRWIGLASAIALPSSFWFLFRARSGNLDVPLTFFFLLSLLLILKAAKNSKFLPPFFISLSFLFLSKTLVPLTIIPALILIFWKTKISFKEFMGPLLMFILIVGGWFLYQLSKEPNFLNHYLGIGLPGIKTETNLGENLRLMKEYLHSGVGKWFWPGVAAIFAGPFFSRSRSFWILSLFFLSFFLPFIFSDKGHIWHLIPLHPILILAALGLTFGFIKRIFSQKLAIGVILLASIYISFMQLKISWYQFIDVSKYVSDEAILSRKAAEYSYLQSSSADPLYIDGDFIPSANFYSGKVVQQIKRGTLTEILKEENINLIITYQWRLDEQKIKSSDYTIIGTDRDKILLVNQINLP